MLTKTTNNHLKSQIMKNLIIYLVLLFFVVNTGYAQERNTSYTNVLNPFVYNPSLAGSTEHINAIFNSKGVSSGIDGANRAFNFGLHAPLKNGVGLGAKFLSNSVGVFKTINAEAAFSKMVKLNDKNALSFGLSVGFSQTGLKSELLNSMVNVSDPTLNSAQLNQLLFSSGIGMTYKWNQKFELGLAMPAVITGDKPFNNLLISNASYLINLDKSNTWKVKPMVNFYNFNTGLNMFDGLVQANWKETVSFGGGYRTNGSVIASVGLNFKTIGIQYAYYSQVDGYKALAPSQNEIAIVFGFNKPKLKTSNQALSEEQVQDEIERINEKVNGLVNVDKTNPGLVNMNKELSKLNKELEKILSKYKITNQEQLLKVKNLKSNLESLMMKYND